MKNHFEIFGLTPAFKIDLNILQQRFLILQKKYHPDQFSESQAAHKKTALQISTTLNHAKNILENPAKRAAYCALLCGLDLEKEQSKADLKIIQQQFFWQEQLFEARETYLSKIQQDWQLLLQKLADEFEEVFQITYQKTHQKNYEKSYEKSYKKNEQEHNQALATSAQNIILLFNFSKNW